VLIIRPKTSETVTTAPRPAVVCLHSTGNSKETMRPFMEVSTNKHSLLSLPNTMSIQLVLHALSHLMPRVVTVKPTHRP
jgi:hypothetical protein